MEGSPDLAGLRLTHWTNAVVLKLEQARQLLPNSAGAGHGLSQAETADRKYARADKLLDFTPVISFLRFHTKAFEDVYLILENSNLIGVGASSQSSSGYQSPLRAETCIIIFGGGMFSHSNQHFQNMIAL